MKPVTSILTGSDLHARLAELQRDLDDTTRAYQLAREFGQPVLELLQRRSALAQQLFKTQTDLLLSFSSKG